MRPNATKSVPAVGALARADDSRTQREMRRRESHLRLAFQAAGMGSWTLDLKSEEVTFSVEQGRLFGLGPDRLIGKLADFIALIVPEDQRRLLEALDAAIKDGKELYESRFRSVRPDGELRYMNARGRIERDGVGRAVQMFGVVIDVTEQVRSEEALQHAQHMAEMAASSKNEFLDSVSHEIRSPLSSILSLSEVLHDPSASSDQLRETVADIARNGQELTALIDGILDPQHRPLPPATPGRVEGAPGRESKPAPALQGIRILLAEDVVDNQVLILHLLKTSGAAIDVVDNGASAVERAMTGAYDVVLMDIQMPVMDGLDATQMLRAYGYRKPIVALTAHALVEERQRCLKAGCDEHLTKPFSYKDLVAVVTRFVGS